MVTIPKIIHQIWLGDKTMPIKYAETWKRMNPTWKHMIWTDETIKEHFPNGLYNQKQFDEIDSWAGKADILRYEILYNFGGIYADFDSICIQPLSDQFCEHDCFASFENRQVRGDLIANGYIGAVERCELIKVLMDKIHVMKSVSFKSTGLMAWQTVGPLFFTNTIIELNYPISIYPDYTFIPEHYSGMKYTGDYRYVFAKQIWGSTHEIANPNFYNTLSEKKDCKISILIPIKNTPKKEFVQCIESIRLQTFKEYEIVIVDDGSTDLELIGYLQELSVLPNVTLITTDGIGIGSALNLGMEHCLCEYVARMDSDDIMLANRLQEQYEYLEANKDVTLVSANIQYFNQNGMGEVIAHPEVITKDIARNSFWFINHPTVMFRKSEILKVGGYGNYPGLPEDYELWIRLIKTNHQLRNINKVLVSYRIKPTQTSATNTEKRLEFLQRIQSTL